MRTEEAPGHRKWIKPLREMHKERHFQPVLCVNLGGPVGEYATQLLKEAVAAERENG